MGLRGIRNRQNQIFSEGCGLSQTPSFMTEHSVSGNWPQRRKPLQGQATLLEWERAEIPVQRPFDRSEWYTGGSIQKHHPSSCGMGCWWLHVAIFPSAYSYLFYFPIAVDPKESSWSIFAWNTSSQRLNPGKTPLLTKSEQETRYYGI